jgi:type VI secretion system protein ImpB
MTPDVYPPQAEDPQSAPQLTYDAYTEAGIEQRQLPFVIGVLGDFAGNATIPPLEQREFVTIDPDNFNEAMSHMSPGLRIKIPNSLSDDDTQLNIDLTFKSLDDFSPVEIAGRVPVLRKLLEMRESLARLRQSLVANPKLDQLISELMNDREKLERIRQEEGIG